VKPRNRYFTASLFSLLAMIGPWSRPCDELDGDLIDGSTTDAMTSCSTPLFGSFLPLIGGRCGPHIPTPAWVLVRRSDGALPQFRSSQAPL
jgi:hypothetical protein